MLQRSEFQRNVESIWYPPSKTTKIIAVVIILTLIILFGDFVYQTGGIKYVYSHSMYLAILLGAFFFNAPGGIISGILAGLVLGPRMPIDVATGEMQLTINWVYRILIFSAVGGISGWLFSLYSNQIEKMRWIAFHNPETGLLNMASLIHNVETLNKEDIITPRFVVITMMINNYAQIFNMLDIDQNNQLIMQISERLNNLPFSVPVCQLLSNILGAVYPVPDDDSFWDELVKDLVDEFKMPFYINDIPIYVDLSIGAALYPEHGTNLNLLIRRSNIAAHIANEQGRLYLIYDISRDHSSKESLKLLSNIPKALEENQFSLHFQPVIHMETGQTAGFEVLLRWNHPVLGNIPPLEFLPYAERTSLIHSINDWVIRNSIESYSQFKQQGFEGFLSINLSIKSLQDINWLSQYEDLIKKHSIHPHQLMFEVTETSIIQDFDEAVKFLHYLRQNGTMVALDDFGEGYSSLEYIKNLPFTHIKIDQKFIKDLDGSPKDKEIIRAMIKMAEALNLQVIAEGVEKKSVFDWLKKEGCGYVQGFQISKPLPFDEFLAWIKDHKTI